MRERAYAGIHIGSILFLAFTLSPADLAGQTSVLTHHGDNARTGANLSEALLTPSNVNSKAFGKLATRYVDGNIYAQPLVAAGARAIHRTGPVNLVIVATEHNQVYAFNADDVDPDSTSAMVWNTGQDVFGLPANANTLSADMGKGICNDLAPDIGITGTPVIQMTNQQTPREGVVYVAAKSKDGGSYHYTLFALRLSDGSRIGSVEIEGAVNGHGAGSVEGKIRFDPMLQLNRPGLLLVGNRLYVAFGGHCDMGNYHGWLFSYDVSDAAAMKQVGILATTPNGPAPGSKTSGREEGAGIWMSGEGPSADENGAVYFVTGNGTNNHSTDFGDSVVKVKQEGTTLNVADWFAPENEQQLKDYDVDFGTTGAALLPGSHLLIAGGKDGRMFLLDRDNMGKAGEPLASIQVTYPPTPPWVNYGLFGTPAIWQRGDEMFLYTSGTEDPIRQYRLVRDSESDGWKFDPPEQFKVGSVSAPQGQLGDPHRGPILHFGGFMTISAMGADDTSGILWVTMPSSGNASHSAVRGVLRALNASDVSKPELWNSENTGDENDRVGFFAKFVPPTVANGKVYVATFDSGHGADDEEVATGAGHIIPQDNRASLVIFGLNSTPISTTHRRMDAYVLP